MLSVISVHSTLVAVGSDGGSAAVWTSHDGQTWSRYPDSETVFAGAMVSVAAGDPGLIAVGRQGGSPAVWIWSPNP